MILVLLGTVRMPYSHQLLRYKFAYRNYGFWGRDPSCRSWNGQDLLYATTEGQVMAVTGGNHIKVGGKNDVKRVRSCVKAS